MNFKLLTFNCFLLLTFNCFAQANQSGAGNCLQFSGTSNYVSIGNIATVVQGSMEAWISPSGNYTNTQHVAMGAASSGANSSLRYDIMARHSGVCGGQWGTILGNGTTDQIVCSGQVYNSTNFPAGVWTHLCITYDGTNVRFYKDGILISTVLQTVSGAGNAQPYSIGRGGAIVGTPSNMGYFSGQIDEVRIWNTALTQTQIRDNMCKKLIGNEAGLVGYWRFDETAGNTYFDSSPNGNNGTGF